MKPKKEAANVPTESAAGPQKAHPGKIICTAASSEDTHPRMDERLELAGATVVADLEGKQPNR